MELKTRVAEQITKNNLFKSNFKDLNRRKKIKKINHFKNKLIILMFPEKSIY
jgi:cell division protein FtsL